ncbi:MAG: hypothetical protein MO852_12765 [Candidatus Devosia euplotis]|nr:hypothetical protein [Candidatus Devosia euplotis]
MRAIIAFIDDISEAVVMRAQFESLGWRVAWRPIGKPTDLFDAFGEPADVGVIFGHGDDRGLIFPPLADEVDPLRLPGDRMVPAMLRGFIRRLPSVLISTACGTGTAAFAEAFAAAGARILSHRRTIRMDE